MIEEEVLTLSPQATVRVVQEQDSSSRTRAAVPGSPEVLTLTETP